MKRRNFIIAGAVIGSGAAGTYLVTRTADVRAAVAADGGTPLPIPAVLDAGGAGTHQLDAISGSHEFIGGLSTPTMGYGQPYLGPVIRVKRGETTRIAVTNKTGEPITAHWHGLHVNGAADGGPHTVFGPGKTWAPELAIDQPAATLWYHSHVHGRTADQVYAGLAGMMIVDDPQASDSGLPSEYGVDDIPLIVQDRAFDDAGRFVYVKRGPSLMHGFRGNQIVVNGAIRPLATVPKGMVRLRILNASNARIYAFSFDDRRQFFQAASEGGLLPRPVPLRRLVLAPAERVEVLVDFSDGKSVRLLSEQDTNSPMGGMMRGRGMGMGGQGMGMMGMQSAKPPAVTTNGHFEIMRFAVDTTTTPAITNLPSAIAGAVKPPDWGAPVRRRQFHLDMHMGHGMRGMMGRMMGGSAGGSLMGINGSAMAMDRIDASLKRNETEVWEVFSDQMDHPFHIHGTSFQVLSHNGRSVPFEQTGLKDVFLVRGHAELLVRFSQTADSVAPYMYHCHILEHEDAGMMGQFTVSEA